MRCPECGCRGCADLFDQLLALEFQRTEPYGRLHALTVAAYGVQHPSRFELDVRQAQWSLLWIYVTDGFEAVERTQTARRTANSHRRGGLGDPDHGLDRATPPPLELADDCLGICHVAGRDASFEPTGHEQRVREWIRSLLPIRGLTPPA